MLRRLPALWSSPAQAILYVTLLLVAIGTVNIFSASFVTATREWQGDSYFYLKRHIAMFCLGMGLLWLAARFDYRRYFWLGPVLICGTLITLALVPLMGLEANGARRWLKLAFFSFQPSEVAKLCSIVMTAAYLGWRMEKRMPVSIFSWPFWLTGIMAAFVFRQPDMGTAVVIVMLCLVVYLLAGIPRWEWVSLFFIGTAGGAVAIAIAPYRAERIAAWLNPWAYAQDIGYQAVQALLAIGSGGFSGTGPGMGASKFFYLPEAHTDFAFAVLSQEMGFAGVLAVIVLFLLIAWYGIQVAVKAPDGYGLLLAGGITALIAGQAVGNMAMVCGLLPVTGVPLPYISFGGTSLIVNLAATGVLISIGRQAGSAVPSPERPELTPHDERRAQRKLRLVDRSHTR